MRLTEMKKEKKEERMKNNSILTNRDFFSISLKGFNKEERSED